MKNFQNFTGKIISILPLKVFHYGVLHECSMISSVVSTQNHFDRKPPQNQQIIFIELLSALLYYSTLKSIRTSLESTFEFRKYAHQTKLVWVRFNEIGLINSVQRKLENLISTTIMVSYFLTDNISIRSFKFQTSVTTPPRSLIGISKISGNDRDFLVFHAFG